LDSFSDSSSVLLAGAASAASSPRPTPSLFFNKGRMLSHNMDNLHMDSLHRMDNPHMDNLHRMDNPHRMDSSSSCSLVLSDR
jgi:hypothetical protein